MPDSARKLITTFGRRRGRKLRGARQARVDELLPKVQFSPQETLPAPLWLEIGFGSGEHMVALAHANPRVSFIGCEPYVDGVGTLLGSIEKDAIKNIRIFPDDARLLIEQLPDASVERAFILFPDPWPKSRHHKRRLIQQPFLNTLARIMKPGAELRLATDHADYLTWMLEQMLASPHFAWTAKHKSDWEQPPADWVQTGYQQWAEKEGRRTTYLSFVRR